ncbi:hypothetical protein PO909_012767 [Leuciscus waleckii]
MLNTERIQHTTSGTKRGPRKEHISGVGRSAQDVCYIRERKRPVSVRGMRTVRCEVNNSAPDGNSTQLGSYCSREGLLLVDLDLDASSAEESGLE